MSVSSSGSNAKTAVHDQTQARAQAQQEQQAKNEAQARAFQKASTPSNNGIFVATKLVYHHEF